MILPNSSTVNLSVSLSRSIVNLCSQSISSYSPSSFLATCENVMFDPVFITNPVSTSVTLTATVKLPYVMFNGVNSVVVGILSIV